MKNSGGWRITNIKFFRDPIHDFIDVDPIELKIISTPIFQRLRRIKQLGPADYVFHGATHTRFGHSLGVMYITKRILNNIDFSDPKLEDEKKKINLAALLHDIGHLPYSHTFEDVIKHLGIKNGHETYTEAIIRYSEIKDILKENYSHKEFLHIIQYVLGKRAEYMFSTQLIHSEMDADRMDYLLRDSLYCGVKYGIYDLERLLISFDINKDNYLLVLKKGLNVVEEFLLARFYMYRQVYIHKTKKSFEIILSRIVEKLIENDILKFPIKMKDVPEELIIMDDYWLFMKLKELRKNRKIDKNTLRLIELFLNREPLKLLIEKGIYIDKIDVRYPESFARLMDILNNKKFVDELDKAQISPEEIFFEDPKIDIKKYSPFSSESGESSIYTLDDTGNIIDIANKKDNLINEISSKLYYTIRIYTYRNNYKKILNILKKIGLA